MLRVDAQLKTVDVTGTESAARDAEVNGYAGLWTAETAHDPFLPAVLAAARTQRLEIGTAVAVAFARNPMTLAHTAHDLQVLSRGRFRLGIGSQVKAHIERRFGMPWSEPAARMRDFVLALRAIWADWNDDVPLAHEGRFYRHTLMTPMFRPARCEWGAPPIFLAAVGERMIGVAGELADGLILHPFGSPQTLRERTLVTLASALRDSARTRGDVEVSLPLLVATGVDDAALARAVDAVRNTVAFYASTPAYRWVLEHHGLAELADQLTGLSRSGGEHRWSVMSALVDDDVVRQFAVVAPAAEVGDVIRNRYDGLVDRVSLYMPYRIDAGVVGDVAADVRR